MSDKMSSTYIYLMFPMKNIVSIAQTKTDLTKISFERILEKSVS